MSFLASYRSDHFWVRFLKIDVTPLILVTKKGDSVSWEDSCVPWKGESSAKRSFQAWGTRNELLINSRKPWLMQAHVFFKGYHPPNCNKTPHFRSGDTLLKKGCEWNKTLLMVLSAPLYAQAWNRKHSLSGNMPPGSKCHSLTHTRSIFHSACEEAQLPAWLAAASQTSLQPGLGRISSYSRSCPDFFSRTQTSWKQERPHWLACNETHILEGSPQLQVTEEAWVTVFESPHWIPAEGSQPHWVYWLPPQWRWDFSQWWSEDWWDVGNTEGHL